MSQGNVPITPEGHQRHTDELKQLKSVARPKVIQEIATAREHGLRVDVLAEVPSSEALIDALAAFGTTLALRAREAGLPARRPSERRAGSRRRSR